jgi:hypothetical protein
MLIQGKSSSSLAAGRRAFGIPYTIKRQFFPSEMSVVGTVAWTSALFLSCATFAAWLLFA